jgi:hypothetical protein
MHQTIAMKRNGKKKPLMNENITYNNFLLWTQRQRTAVAREENRDVVPRPHGADQ